MLLQLLCIKDSSTHFEFEVLILISRVGEARGKSKKVLTKIHPVRKRLIKARGEKASDFDLEAKSVRYFSSPNWANNE